jgi:hypothetical protein
VTPNLQRTMTRHQAALDQRHANGIALQWPVLILTDWHDQALAMVSTALVYDLVTITALLPHYLAPSHGVVIDPLTVDEVDLVCADRHGGIAGTTLLYGRDPSRPHHSDWLPTPRSLQWAGPLQQGLVEGTPSDRTLEETLVDALARSHVHSPVTPTRVREMLNDMVMTYTGATGQSHWN